MANNLTYEIRQRLAVLKTNEKSGWSKEANIISWNNGPDKLDIREWNPEHTKMSKGMTFDSTEAAALRDAITKALGD